MDPLSVLGVFDPIFALKSFVALFVIVDTLGMIPIFISLLQDYSEDDKKAIISLAVRVAAITLILLTFLGRFIFAVLGIEMYSFRIAGGLILLILSIQMLFGKKPHEKGTLPVEKEDIAVTPLAIPLLSGPGAITSGIILSDEAASLADQFVLGLAIVLVFLISYMILSRLKGIYSALGPTGVRVVTRVSGILLSAISVQFIISGFAEAVSSGLF